MSSTNRGAARQEFDYYVTDPDEVRRFLRAWQEDEHGLQGVKRVLDPCAGGNTKEVQWEYKPGVVLTVPPTEPTYPTVLREFFSGTAVRSMDVRDDAPVDFCGDFLAAEDMSRLNVDLVISNPPFALALEFIQRALEIVRPGAWVVMLLRLNFFGSQKRKPFFEQHMPERVYIHNKRMSFTPDGKADSVEYMHAVWRKGHHPRAALTRVI